MMTPPKPTPQTVKITWQVVIAIMLTWSVVAIGVVSQSEVLGRFYNPNTTPKDKERVVVCLRGTGQELH